MLKLTRLDHRTVAINPDHVAWVEATPDTTLCLLGDRKIIVRESVDEVIERFIEARARVGCSPIQIPGMPLNGGAMSNHPSRRPSGRPSALPSGGYLFGNVPSIIDDPSPPSGNGPSSGRGSSSSNKGGE